MAKIILGSYMFRYPLGGMLSWALQYIMGLKECGHDIYFVEKAEYENACFNPAEQIMTNDCTYGLKLVSRLFSDIGLGEKWCFVSYDHVYFGLSKNRIEGIFAEADLFIDMGTHGAWAEESLKSALRVLVDGEPGYTQINFSNKLKQGIPVPHYDHYFTNGKNIGTADNPVPVLNLKWESVYSPVCTRLFNTTYPCQNGPYSTIMNWTSHDPIEFQGKKFGQKDIEFMKFVSLPKKLSCTMEVAVSGKNVPTELLLENRWRVCDAQLQTLTVESFQNYILHCKGEFSVCKHVFVANQTGWFSDKSAAYLASGRPVVLQNTGFDKFLPVGKGLFTFTTMEEAIEAIKEIEKNYSYHSRKAREIAREFLEASKVMHTFLNTVGI